MGNSQDCVIYSFPASSKKTKLCTEIIIFLCIFSLLNFNTSSSRTTGHKIICECVWDKRAQYFKYIKQQNSVCTLNEQPGDKTLSDWLIFSLKKPLFTLSRSLSGRDSHPGPRTVALTHNQQLGAIKVIDWWIFLSKICFSLLFSLRLSDRLPAWGRHFDWLGGGGVTCWAAPAQSSPPATAGSSQQCWAECRRCRHAAARSPPAAPAVQVAPEIQCNQKIRSEI